MDRKTLLTFSINLIHATVTCFPDSDNPTQLTHRPLLRCLGSTQGSSRANRVTSTGYRRYRNDDPFDLVIKFTGSYSLIADEYGGDFAIEVSHPDRRLTPARARSRGIRADGTGELISMASPQLILPRADAGCGKIFYEERRIADEHRIALEFWNRATGRIRQGYHLAVYRCKRCGGFHIGHKRTQKAMISLLPPPDHPG